MLHRTLVAYPEDSLHMQALWVKIWISSCYEVFTVSIDGESDITDGLFVSTECLFCSPTQNTSITLWSV